MIRLTLVLYGVPAIRTRPLTRAEAAARIARWRGAYYKAGTVAEEAA